MSIRILQPIEVISEVEQVRKEVHFDVVYAVATRGVAWLLRSAQRHSMALCLAWTFQKYTRIGRDIFMWLQSGRKRGAVGRNVW
jgi:hypothetical protein